MCYDSNEGVGFFKFIFYDIIWIHFYSSARYLRGIYLKDIPHKSQPTWNDDIRANSSCISCEWLGRGKSDLEILRSGLSESHLQKVLPGLGQSHAQDGRLGGYQGGGQQLGLGLKIV